MFNRVLRLFLIFIVVDYKDYIDVDGDDEFVINDEDEDDGFINIYVGKKGMQSEFEEEDYFIMFMII